MTRPWGPAWLVLLSALAAGSAGAQALRYRVVVLPDSLPGIRSSLSGGINAAGDVVGGAQGNDANMAVVWSGPAHTMQQLPDLSPGVAGDTSRALAINDNGVVVGLSGDPDGHTVATSWIGGQPINLGDLPRGEVFGIATAVNAAGQLAGLSVVGGLPATGGRWNAFTVSASGGSLLNLGDLPGGANDARANGINDDGLVVGRSSVGWRSQAYHAFLWTPGVGMQDLGDLPGGSDHSEALAVNGDGVVVGWSNGSAGQRAFRWTAALGMQDLGLPPGATLSVATGVNEAGLVVGIFAGAPGIDTGAFVWDPAGGLQNLFDLIDPSDPERASLAAYLYATGVNAAGWIAATGRRPGSSTNSRALLLIPM